MCCFTASSRSELGTHFFSKEHLARKRMHISGSQASKRKRVKHDSGNFLGLVRLEKACIFRQYLVFYVISCGAESYVFCICAYILLLSMPPLCSSNRHMSFAVLDTQTAAPASKEIKDNCTEPSSVCNTKAEELIAFLLCLPSQGADRSSFTARTSRVADSSTCFRLVEALPWICHSKQLVNAHLTAFTLAAGAKEGSVPAKINSKEPEECKAQPIVHELGKIHQGQERVILPSSDLDTPLAADLCNSSSRGPDLGTSHLKLKQEPQAPPLLHAAQPGVSVRRLLHSRRSAFWSIKQVQYRGMPYCISRDLF